jgi:uncharacterized repeat protein (TIGR03803 family)
MRNVIQSIVLGAFLVCCGHSTQAQTENVLYSFVGSPDGASPYSGLIRYKGDFYGTTMLGGASNLGTVFKVTPKGIEMVLHSFAGGADGSFPYYGLVFDKEGNAYGTTPNGGTSNSGTVFMMTPSGTETVVYSFTGGADGAGPSSGLIFDEMGNLYGTTGGGGAYGAGTVFELSLSGREKILYSFTGGADGGGPAGGLVRDSKGDLFGTAGGGVGCLGGNGGCGVVFEVTRSGSETVLHAFTGDVNDGMSPSSGLVGLGDMYGTTSEGGEWDRGTVYLVTSSGGETVLFSFLVSLLGYTPSGNLLAYGGSLYGTTLYAAYPPCYCGTIYELSGSNFNLLHDFTDNPDGASPNGYLVVDSKGRLYGTTQSGGTSGKGTVFELIP